MEFKLSERFIENYRDKQPRWGFGDLSYFVYKRTYARKKDDGNQEEFWETCRRVVEGTFRVQKKHCSSLGLPWDGHRAQRSAQKMFEKMWEFKFSPPGRGLWIMGTPLVDKLGSAALQNCGFISTKDIRKDFSLPFTWACDMLMLGVGIGFDTRGAETFRVHKPEGEPTTYTIPDTREGWVESVKLLLDSYTGNKNPVTFIYDKIRPAGALIAGFGGTASGPEPLRDGHEAIRRMLDGLDGQLIDSVTITDIMNLIGKFVVAGNVRRSAEIAIGNLDDNAFVTMKDPNEHPEAMRNHRWASNNSVFATAESNFNSVIDSIATNGEPGLIFIDNARHYGRFKDGYNPPCSSKYDDVDGFNPCGEQSLAHGELCCLVETYPANHETPEEYYETLKYAYLYAKTVTLIPTHSALTNQVMLRNRRIGLGMSGIQQALKRFGSATFFTQFCDEGYKHVRHWDRIYSRWLGIPNSIKVTTVKPSGSVSLLAGATPGVHCTHSEHYLRTLRVAANHPLLTKLANAGYKIELDVTNRGQYNKVAKGTEAPKWFDGITVQDIPAEVLSAYGGIGGSIVVYFPIQEQNFTKSKSDISLWEQLILVKMLQDRWSDNSVSCTVTFNKAEVKDLKTAIEFFAPYVKTLSFLPLDDNTYAQPPYTKISVEEYEQYQSSLKKLRLGKGKQAAQGERYCDGDICTV